MADRKTEILKATCRVIGRSGAHDLRVEDVAKEAGVSPALVYYYFDTRGELLSRAFDYADQRSTEHTMTHIDLDAPGRERLEEMLFHEFDEAPDVRENWVIWSEMDAIAIFDKELLVAVEKRSANWTKIVADLIRAGQADGSITVDGITPEDVAERLTAINDALGTKLMLGMLDRGTVERVMHDSIEMDLGTAPSQ